jgi:hypothetical protein
MMTLFDLNDHKDYGEYFKTSLGVTPSAVSTPFICTVQDKICHSESEWWELLKPYMEN